MGFKFLSNIPDEPLTFGEMQLTYNVQEEFPQVQYFRDPRNPNDVSDAEWNLILEHERKRLVEAMFINNNIVHTIVSQDENGFTLRTEIFL